MMATIALLPTRWAVSSTLRGRVPRGIWGRGSSTTIEEYTARPILSPCRCRNRIHNIYSMVCRVRWTCLGTTDRIPFTAVRVKARSITTPRHSLHLRLISRRRLGLSRTSRSSCNSSKRSSTNTRIMARILPPQSSRSRPLLLLLRLIVIDTTPRHPLVPPTPRRPCPKPHMGMDMAEALTPRSVKSPISPPSPPLRNKVHLLDPRRPRDTRIRNR
jgi:hypothetical protein